MSKDKNRDSFWLSYSDLMTSLFFIMLVLFVVCICKLGKSLHDANASTEQLRRILQLEELFAELTTSSTLQYVDEHKTFIAKDFEGIEIFEPNKSAIKQEHIKTVDRVGRDLQNLLKELDKTNKGTISYLLIIEGNTANTSDHKYPKDSRESYKLSYERALALYLRWRQNGIDLRQYNTEIQICGSGMNGINRDNKVEDNNKRFVIQIIPKVSRPQ